MGLDLTSGLGRRRDTAAAELASKRNGKRCRHGPWHANRSGDWHIAGPGGRIPPDVFLSCLLRCWLRQSPWPRATAPVIPYGQQTVDEDDVAAVIAVLRGRWLTQGPHVATFEDRIADVTGARFAVAFTSGTAALHAGVSAAGLGPGHVVATSPLSFVASAACARYVGATPSFVDIEESTLNLDPSLVPEECDALVAVHYAGLPLDLTRLRHRPRVIIEDAAHALGALTPSGPVGNCAHSDMCIFSFHPVKAITTGEGGAVTTNSEELATRLRAFRHHGIRRSSNDHDWNYEVRELGFNYRLTDIQAALGSSQLLKLKSFVDRRNVLGDRYRVMLEKLPVGLPPAAPRGFQHAYHLFPIQISNRAIMFDQLRRSGIGVQVHYVPIYHHPFYADLGFDSSTCPVTESVYSRLLSLPLFPSLAENQQDEVVEVLCTLL